MAADDMEAVPTAVIMHRDLHPHLASNPMARRDPATCGSMDIGATRTATTIGSTDTGVGLRVRVLRGLPAVGIQPGADGCTVRDAGARLRRPHSF